jgi:hypothetical protein
MKAKEKIIRILRIRGFHKVEPEDIIPAYGMGCKNTHRKNTDEWYYEEDRECLWSAPAGMGGICLYYGGKYATLQGEYEEIEI